MDPFDDFDPQNFDYDDSDQEDDIVYLEGPVQGEDPFLPYLAKDVELSQSQMSQQQQQHQQQVPNLLPRRERQRRRAEQILMEEESSDSELSHQDNATGEENAFASLQSLLEKQSQQAKENAAANQDESVAAVDVREGTALGRDPPSIAQEEPEHAVPVQDANENLIPETQSQQFPLAEDWDLTQENPTQARSVPMVSNSAAEYASMSLDAPSISAGLVKELRRVQKQKHIVSEPSAMVNLSKAVDSNLLSELHKNRKRLAQEKATSGPRKRSGGSIKSNPPQFHRNRTRKTHVTKDTKSIVGSRPQHWGAARTPKHPSATKRARKLAVSPKSSHLAAVVQKEKSRPRLSLSQPGKSSLLNNSKSGRSLDEVTSRISFAPHFFHTRKSSDQHEDDEIESSQRPERSAPAYQTPRILQRFNQNPSAAYSAGSSNGSDPAGKRKRKQSGKKLKAGPLMKRLRALRSAVDGDTIRFQSGMYPFAQSANRRFDLSDPRNRAASYMDVSIVCEPVPWDEHERITTLGFIHNSVQQVSSRRASNDHDNLIESGRFAWLCFTYVTAREQNVRKGSKLRIYNAVCIPSSSAIQVDGYGFENGVVKDSCCDHMILCTQLCEAYPDSLPALPDVVYTSNC